MDTVRKVTAPTTSSDCDGWFGHKVLVAQTDEKLISHFRSLPKREEDPALLSETLDAHRKLFGAGPAVGEFAGICYNLSGLFSSSNTR
jgi:hypothetical protein